MNTEKMSHLVSMVANFGVIAGIVFLGFELQQNNQLMVEEARYNNLSQRITTNQHLLSNPEIQQLAVSPPDNPTPLQQAQLRYLHRNAWLTWQWEYQVAATGIYSWAELEVLAEDWQRAFQDRQMADLWESEKDIAFASDFVQWMDENVAN